MAKKDIFGDEVKNRDENDFASMLEGSMRQGRLRPGDSFKGEILSINKEFVYVSTPGSADGHFAAREILDDKKLPRFKVGDKVDVVVLKVKESEVLLRFKDATSSSEDVENLEDAFDMEIPVQGRVLEMVKGGFRVDIQGHRAFCPLSQMEQRPPAQAADYVGKKFDFLITAYEENGRNIVISRRRLLDIKTAELEGKMLETAQIGELYEGTITRLEKYGAFVRLSDGLEGLIPVSELSWSRGTKTEDVVQLGMQVRVKLLKMQEEDGRLRMSFSFKQGGGESDPWLRINDEFPIGRVIEGSVEKKETFGLFVNIGPGITGLLPRSAWRDSTEASTFENKKKGDRITVQVADIRNEERKLAFSLPGEAIDESWKNYSSASKGSLGSFGDLLKAAQKKK